MPKMKMEPGTCSKCGGKLDALFRCYSEVCAGRYRHPVNTKGDPCRCNQGHVSKNSVR